MEVRLYASSFKIYLHIHSATQHVLKVKRLNIRLLNKSYNGFKYINQRAFLCLLNVFFMAAGTFLNSVVMICLRSRQKFERVMAALWFLFHPI